MEQKLSIDVTCETQEIAAKYEELSRKMLNDKEFQEALKLCKSDREIYDLYTKHGYTDLSFEDFSKEFSSIMEQMLGSNDASTMELTTEELENVVGGFNFFRFITSTVSVIPIAGPLISGVAKAVKAGIDGKGLEGITLEVAKGLGTAMVDAVVTIGTAGAGTAVTMGAKVAMGAVKAGLGEAEIL